MHGFPQPRLMGSTTKQSLLLVSTATALMLVGMAVLACWHAPQLLTALYPKATLMAYNTALGFIACGLGMLALATHKQSPLVASVLILWLISVSSLIELLTDYSLHSSDWFFILLAEPPARNQIISPTASSAFLLAGIALLLSRSKRGLSSLFASLICLLIVLIVSAAALGQWLNLLSNDRWLSIKLAPHTIVGLIAFALVMIRLHQRAAIKAFGRLNFFNRLITGFIFMSLLFVAIGSIAIAQINSVAAISHQFYSGPLQVSNATLKIKASISGLNRAVKDVAVAPELASERKLPEFIAQSTATIVNQLALIQEHPEHTLIALQLNTQVNQWRQLLLAIHQRLEAGELDFYRAAALGESQDMAQQLEQMCDQIIQQVQAETLSLNNQALTTKNQAGNLILVVMLGFLAMGILVSALITHSLSWQLQNLRKAMLALAQGNTHIHIPFLSHPHVVGDMAKTLKIFAKNIEERDKSSALLAEHQLELENLNRQLAQSNSELEAFAYVASHDLKSPLRGIAQLSSWIEEDLLEQQFDEVNKHTLMMRKRIQRMEQLLDDLLLFYRAGKADGQLKHLDVKQMATELFDIQNTQPGLRLELSDTLPSFTTLCTPFEQVLRNLLSNALKHHDRTEGVIRLDCKPLPNGFYQFSICDDGPGIPEKFQARVFGMFQTLKPRDELEGSGMGLALITKIVTGYGGNIHLVSEGRGCCFYFTWPEQINKEATPHG